jgi:hypothetical protein
MPALIHFIYSGGYLITLINLVVIGLVLTIFNRLPSRFKWLYIASMILSFYYGFTQWTLSHFLKYINPMQTLNLFLILFFYFLSICVNFTYLKPFKHLKINTSLWIYSPFMFLLISLLIYLYQHQEMSNLLRL